MTSSATDVQRSYGRAPGELRPVEIEHGSEHRCVVAGGGGWGDERCFDLDSRSPVAVEHLVVS